MQTTLVMLPGLDGMGDLFSPITSQLKGVDCQVVSYPPNTPMSYAQLTDFVKQKLPNQPYVLLAESFSGPIGIAIAAENPPHLQGLILSACYAHSPVKGAKWLAQSLKIISPKWLPNAVASFLLMGKFYRKDLAAILAQSLEQLSAPVLKTRLSEALKTDVRHEFKQIKCPILYLQAKHDFLVNRAVGAELKNLSKHMILKRFNGPHLLLQIASNESSQAILNFIFKESTL